jgi:hypothetical protein
MASARIHEGTLPALDRGCDRKKRLVIPQRFFGIPPFRFYALADGIRRLTEFDVFCRAAHSSRGKNRRPTRNSNSPLSGHGKKAI